MNSFQEQCINKSKIVLTEMMAKTNANFEEVIGKSQRYYKLTLDIEKHKFELFIYLDEAGIMIDGRKWIICEKYDYSSQDDLIEDYLLKLRDEIQAISSAKA